MLFNNKNTLQRNSNTILTCTRCFFRLRRSLHSSRTFISRVPNSQSTSPRVPNSQSTSTRVAKNKWLTAAIFSTWWLKLFIMYLIVAFINFGRDCARTTIINMLKIRFIFGLVKSINTYLMLQNRVVWDEFENLYVI